MQATVRHHTTASFPRVLARRHRTLSALAAGLLTLIGIHEH